MLLLFSVPIFQTLYLLPASNNNIEKILNNKPVPLPLLQQILYVVKYFVAQGIHNLPPTEKQQKYYLSGINSKPENVSANEFEKTQKLN